MAAEIQGEGSAALDQAGVARHLDMSERNLRDVMRRLDIDWPVEVDEIRIRYIRDLREKAAGRGGDDQQELTRSRVRESQAKARNLELQNYERVGQLVAVEELEPLLDQWVIMSRTEVSNAVNKIVADIQGQFDIEIDSGLIDEHMSAAYRIIGTYPGRRSGDGQDYAGSDDNAGGRKMDTAGESTDA